MILVSYIDILDYVGEDRQCLIQGEELFNDDTVSNVHVRYRASDDAYDVSAVCVSKNSTESINNNDISIGIEKSVKKSLNSKCSCELDSFGKCKHVVATLIYLHRHPLDRIIEKSQCEDASRSQSQTQKRQNNVTMDSISEDSKETVQKHQRRLRHKRKSAVLSTHVNVNVTPEVMKNESKPSYTNFVKSEKEEFDEELEDDPTWDKENDGDEDETFDDWAFSSDDDWEPVSEKKRSRKESPKVTFKSSNMIPKSRKRNKQMTKAEADKQATDLTAAVQQGQDKMFSCHVCDIKLPERDQLRDHIRDVHLLKNDGFACNKCERVFKLLTTLKAHESICDTLHSSHDENEDSANDCEQNPDMSEDEAPREEPLQCLLCEVVTDRRRAMHDHYLLAHRSHDKDSVAVCDRCGEFRLPRDHNCPSQLSFRCHMCRSPFKAGRDYWNHLIRQSKRHCSQAKQLGRRGGGGVAAVRGWRCGWPACAERFPGEEELLAHARLHLPDHVALMCAVCGLMLRNTDAKILHMEKHDVGVYECSACRAAFGDKGALRDHWESHAAERPHRCDTCGWRFSNATALQVHASKFHERGPYRCAKCPQKFDDKTDVRIHFAAAHGKLRCPARACTFRCANKTSLERHASQAHASALLAEDDDKEAEPAEVHDESEAASFPCPREACGEAFAQQRALRAHLRAQHEEHPPGRHIVCQDCQKTFRAQRDLDEHRRTHTGEKPFICAECGMTFKRAQNLEHHTKGAHKNERNFVCPECGKRFISNADMKRHLRYSHQNGKKWHLCPECGHKLPSLYNLKLHVQSRHTGERPNKCPHCDSAFVASSDLKKHIMYKHDKKMPFGCELCDKRYQRRRDLQLHQERHHDVQQHSCAVCGKEFETYASMMQHARYHTTEEAYQCAKCGRRFPHRMNLSRHLCTPDIKKNFHCHTCGLNFTTGGSLKSHRRRLHASDTSKPPPPPEPSPPALPAAQSAAQPPTQPTTQPEIESKEQAYHTSPQSEILHATSTPQQPPENDQLQQEQRELQDQQMQHQQEQLHHHHHHHHHHHAHHHHQQEQLHHQQQAEQLQLQQEQLHHHQHQERLQQQMQGALQHQETHPVLEHHHVTVHLEPQVPPEAVGPVATVYEDYGKDKLWRGMGHDPWGLAPALPSGLAPALAPGLAPALAPGLAADEAIMSMAGCSSYHELENAQPAAMHLLPGPPTTSAAHTLTTSPGGQTAGQHAGQHAEQHAGQPLAATTLVMKSGPPPLVSLHVKADSQPHMMYAGQPGQAGQPTVKLVSMTQPPPLTSLSSSSPSIQSHHGQGSVSSLILGAPIQTTADGSFHLVFVPHGASK